MKKIEAFTLPYYELIMNDGTLCDLNGQPRVTRVHYVISKLNVFCIDLFVIVTFFFRFAILQEKMRSTL